MAPTWFLIAYIAVPAVASLFFGAAVAQGHGRYWFAALGGLAIGCGWVLLMGAIAEHAGWALP